MGASNNTASTTTSFLNDQLSKKTSIFGLRLWVLIGIGVGAFIVLILFVMSLWLTSRKKSSKRLPKKLPSTLIPMISKEIQEVRIDPLGTRGGGSVVASCGRNDSSDRDMEKVVLIGYGHHSKASSHSSKTELGANGGKPIKK